MKKKGCLILGISVTSLIIIGVIVLYRMFFIPHGINIDKDKYPVTGIDISAHTGKVDFEEIQKQNIDFVYLKATEGENFVDPKFEENYKNVIKNKFPVGFYHFFRFNKDGVVQAHNFLQNIKDKETHLPLVIDVEEWGNLSSKSQEEVVSEISKFINTVENSTQSKIMIYSNESSYKKYIEGNFDNKEVWICSFSKKPNIEKEWVFWQHSHKGKLDGADGWVDINTFNGTYDEWNKYLKK
ncbi:hypothetical protein NLM59_10075 [Weeksellaceae bacterium KMM 9724]|uniref:glycoside hydrolase family 25 protein n=1 Tax=Profundicola chukchiensis TaxID=2961959 RepID=UPI00243A15EA|nr:GH25 family lysozyme [Profundicola chukchiensis]MDG4951274.1 hypothetical protein [Profundicola chukchiensis]